MDKSMDSVAQSLWMVGAGLSFALMAECIKVATEHMGVFELGLWRSIGGVAVMYAIMSLRGETVMIRHPLTHLGRAVWGIAAIIMFYHAIDVLEPSTAYALNYTAPIVFIILSATYLRERLDWRILVAASCCFLGVLTLLRPDFDDTETVAAVVGIVSGVCAALAFLMVRKLGTLGEGGMRTVFFLNVHGTVFCAVGLGLAGEMAGLGAQSILPVMGVIVFATTGQLTLTQALHRGDSAVAAALSYSGVVFAVAIDAGLRGIEFAPRDYVGFAMIVGFGAATLLLAKRNSRIKLQL